MQDYTTLRDRNPLHCDIKYSKYLQKCLPENSQPLEPPGWSFCRVARPECAFIFPHNRANYLLNSYPVPADQRPRRVHYGSETLIRQTLRHPLDWSARGTLQPFWLLVVCRLAGAKRRALDDARKADNQTCYECQATRGKPLATRSGSLLFPTSDFTPRSLPSLPSSLPRLDICVPASLARNR